MLVSVWNGRQTILKMDGTVLSLSQEEKKRVGNSATLFHGITFSSTQCRSIFELPKVGEGSLSLGELGYAFQ